MAREEDRQPHQVPHQLVALPSYFPSCLPSCLPSNQAWRSQLIPFSDPQELAVRRGMKREREEEAAEDEDPARKRHCLNLLNHLVEEKERLRLSLERVSTERCHLQIS